MTDEAVAHVNTSPGALIVFEGMDGSGKTTLVKEVVERLSWRTPPVHLAFPSRTGPVGKLVRQAFAKDPPLTEPVLGYLMVADLLDHEPSIRGALALGTCVVCDRHATVSGLAYQREVWSLEHLLGVQQRHQFTPPSVTFVLDVPAEEAIERRRARNQERNEIFEKEDLAYANRLRARYLAYQTYAREPVYVLKGMQTPQQLLDVVAEVLRNGLGVVE